MRRGRVEKAAGRDYLAASWRRPRRARALAGLHPAADRRSAHPFNLTPPPPLRANYLYLFHLWLAPTSLTLRRACFAFAAGPLAWAIAAFRNALVFHSMDKMTRQHLWT